MAKKYACKSESAGLESTTELKKDNSPYVAQRDKISYTLRIRELPWTEKQKAIIELLEDKNTRMVFISGPAGSSKSILATYAALQLINAKKSSELIYIRSIIESASRSLGSLPGEAGDKFKPFAAPLLDKMEELLSKGDCTKLFEDDRIKPTPVNYLRGASFNANCVVVDESQNLAWSELVTVITRIGKYGKFIICGDPDQSDLHDRRQTGFKPMFDLFNTEESREQGIFCVQLGKEDIMRSEILKYIVEKLEDHKPLL